MDYRKLNHVTVKDSYPIPRIDESLDSLSGAKCFSTLDLCSGYWQVELDQEAKEKSAFVVRGGLYQWTVIPFGLCNAPSTFERLMENVMAGLQWEVLLVYLDDIIVFGKTVEEEIQRLQMVFQRLRKAYLKLKPKKCALFQRKVLYLGHVVSSAGISTDPEKVQVIREWPTPRCLKEVQSFLGLTSYYRRYVKGYCGVARPLQMLTEKNRAFNWTDQCEEAFNKLKECLMSAPILSFPDPDGGMFCLDTDASGYGMGTVLFQQQKGHEVVIAHASTSLKRAERNYCVTRRELLAVITFVKHFTPYLYGRKFIVRTDHGSLRWLLNFRNPEGQVARWIQVLGEYDYEVVHRPGRGHGNADGLSRRPCVQCQLSEGEAEVKSPDVGKKVKKKKNLSVQWKNDSELVEVRYFDHDPEERVDTCSVREYFLGYCGGPVEPDRSEDVGYAGAVRSGSTPSNQGQGAMPDCQLRRNDAGRREQSDRAPDSSDCTVRKCRNQRYGQYRRKNRKYFGSGGVQLVTLTSLWNEQEMKAAQETDPDLSLIIKAKQRNAPKPKWEEVSPLSKAEICYWTQWDRLELRKGMLHSRWESADGKTERWQLVVPEKYKEDVLKELHSSRTAGHFGVTKTREKVRERFYWVAFNKDASPGSESVMYVLEGNLLVLVAEPSCNKRLLDIEISEWQWISLDLSTRQQQEIDPC